MKKYSIVIPVFNRPEEIRELLESVERQTFKNFEVIIVEDGSEDKCDTIVSEYAARIDIRYFYKENTGPGDSRNFGMRKALGRYFVFFDSDCVIPADYLEKVKNFLTKTPLDAFGGPDRADASFSNIQRAINYAMTSTLTTGGVRGKENTLDHYQPRSFNMGIRRAVYESVGGFSDIHPGEDPDLSYRIMEKGFKVGLIKNAFVYHKRRVDFRKFIKQVYKFGVVRPILIKWYPDKFKLTYLLPSLFLLGSLVLVILSLSVSWVFILPLLLLIWVIWVDALFKTKSLSISLLSIAASLIQLYGYGYGFLKSAINILLLKKNERKVFRSFFFDRA